MKRGVSPPEGDTDHHGKAPSLSVILPVYNAMPWLPIAVRDMLKQDLDGESLELLCCDDGSSDGSLNFLQELSLAMGEHRAAFEAKRRRTEDTAASPTPASNPALQAELRASEDKDHPSFAGQDIPDDMKALMEKPVTAADVCAAARPEHSLLVLSSHPDGGNRGQGAAMTACLKRVRAPFIAQMESDDERERSDAFKVMLKELRSREELDAVGCLARCVGWKREGMQRYTRWQNALVSQQENAAGRFIEQPALHQTAMFRTAIVHQVLRGDGQGYRDGRDASAGDAGGGDLDVPVDYFFWLSFFHAGKAFAKLQQELFNWRQHPRQHTRTHGRLSVESLRKLKAFFLCREGGPAHGRHVQVWSVGKTLDSWIEDLTACKPPPTSVAKVEWKPGAPIPKVGNLQEPRGVDGHSGGAKVMRLFAFGLEKARTKIRQQIKDWDDADDWFVA